MVNLALLQKGYNIALVPPVIRAEYISSIEEAHENSDAFMKLICRSVYETGKDYLRMFNA